MPVQIYFMSVFSFQFWFLSLSLIAREPRGEMVERPLLYTFKSLALFLQGDRDGHFRSTSTREKLRLPHDVACDLFGGGEEGLHVNVDD